MKIAYLLLATSVFCTGAFAKTGRSGALRTKAENAQAYQYVETKNYPAAIAILEKQVERLPESIDARLSLASVFEMAGQLDRAEEQLLKCVDLEKKQKELHPELHLLFGTILLRSGNWPNALSEFDAAKAISPKDPAPFETAALQLINTRDPLLTYMGIKYINGAIELGSRDPKISLHKALGLSILGEKQEGLRLLRTCYAKLSRHGQKDRETETNLAGAIQDLEHEIAARKPAAVPPEKRRYDMSSGMAAVVIGVSRDGKISKLAIFGGHDPDGGKQDGNDDGLIETPTEGLSHPDAVYRRK